MSHSRAHLASLFALPFFLYGGVALQAAGLYLCALLLPVAWTWREQRHLAGPDRGFATRAGLCLLLLWLLFPLTNLLNSPAAATSPVPLSRLLSSQLSSTWLVSAVFLLLLGLCEKRAGAAGLAPSQPAPDAFLSDPLTAFLRGASFASGLFGVYFVVQHLTGFDYRFPGHQLGADRLLGENHLYRISGLYGHPLSMASVALAFVGLFAYLLMANCLARLQGRRQARSWLVSRQSTPWLLWLFIAHFAFLAMSGGRSAVLIGAAAVGLIVGGGLLRCLSLGRAMGLVAACLGLLFAGLYRLGSLGRFEELIAQLQDGSWTKIERLVFWQVHWKIFTDSPWIGRGAAYLSAGVRSLYYDEMGYADFQQKYNAHNIFLEVLADTGLVGFCTLLGGIGYLIVKLKLRMRSEDERHFLAAAVFALLLNAIHGITQNTFYDASVLVVYLAFFWVLFWMSRWNAACPLSDRLLVPDAL